MDIQREQMRVIVASLKETVFSIKTAVLLLFLYGVSIAVGTFIEKGYGTESAWALVYDSLWFELLHLFLALNLMANIFLYRFYRLKKLPLLMFHLAFIVMLVGAAVTRYAGHKGYMDIREGQTQNRMVTENTYLQLRAEKNGEVYTADKLFAPSQIATEPFELSVDVGGKPLTLRSKEFIYSAQKKAVEDENGKPTVLLNIINGPSEKKHFIQSEEVLDTGAFSIYFDREPTDTGYAHVQFITRDDGIYFKTNTFVPWTDLMTKEKGMLLFGDEIALKPNMLFYVGETNIVSVDVLTKGAVRVLPAVKSGREASQNLSGVIVNVAYDGVGREAALTGKSSSFFGEKERLNIGDAAITLEWSSKVIELPFSIKLDDFYIKNFPGSKNLFSFGSRVTLSDSNGTRIKHDIYKNSPLSYGGYKFFQSSYHKDERGTTLLVNYDPGKWPTYAGYAFLMLGLVLNLLSPYSRFGKLVRKKRTLHAAAAFYAAASLLSTQPLHAQTPGSVDEAFAKEFSTLLVQGRKGRVKPFDTAALEIMNKLSGTTSLFGLSHNQVLVGMMAEPETWKRVEMVKTGDRALKTALKIDPDRKFISYGEAKENGWIKTVAAAAKEAWLKDEAERDLLDKEMIKLNERFNICDMAYDGALLKVFPLKDDPEHRWATHGVAQKFFLLGQRQTVDGLYRNFIGSLQEAPKNGDWSAAAKALDDIKTFQHRHGGDLLPSRMKIKSELLYNAVAVFEKLYPLYLVTGVFLLLMTFARLLKPSLNVSAFAKMTAAVVVLGFAAHTLGLGMRWYIAGHAPWSNGYESMLYISWTILFAGVVFARDSEFALSTTAILCALALFVAHLSWMDPEITNVDVGLESYWMTIHVSVITASYGFLGLCALLGLITLLFFILYGRTGSDTEIEEGIAELTRINEISMIAGLSLVAIGNFMGSIWANETWGRYWGWDPKETWALVSIVIYAAVLHMRLIPKLKSAYTFAAASLLSYSTVLMTYFGVNYYLFGKHGYAAGESFPVPAWVYYCMAAVFLLIVLAYRNRNGFADNEA